MMKRSTSFLGLAFTDQSVACAEVNLAGGRRSVRRAATFTFPADATLRAPAVAGTALSAFLRDHKFTATHAIVGVPARWLVAVEKDLPPADEPQAAAALRLQAERLAVAEQGEMIFDYAGSASRSAPTRLLLVGMHRQRLMQIEQLLESAGLEIQAVTSSGLALASVAGQDEGGVLKISRGGGEIVWRQGGSPRMLRHVAVAVNGHEIPSIAALSSDLRRMIALAPTNGSVDSRTLILLDDAVLGNDPAADLSSRLGVIVKSGAAEKLLNVESESAVSAEIAPAVALAIGGAKAAQPTVNFMDSRLKIIPPRRFGRRTVWGIAIGAAALIALVWLGIAVHNKQTTLDQLQANFDSKKDAFDSAQVKIARLTYASGFFAGDRPAVMGCLRSLTSCFRDNERIWANTFMISEGGKCTLTGKSANQESVLALLDRMRKSGLFSDVKLLDDRQADTRTGEWAFSIGFNFTRVE